MIGTLSNRAVLAFAGGALAGGVVLGRYDGSPIIAVLAGVGTAALVVLGGRTELASVLGRRVAMGGLFLAAVTYFFEPTKEVYASALPRGCLYGLISVGVIVIYRTNRIVNFAVAAIGAVPAIFAVILSTTKGWPYLPVLLIALIGGPLLAGLIDIMVIRRFSDSPRLILTVATIGVAQILAFISIYIPIWLGTEDGLSQKMTTPWTSFRIDNDQGTLIIDGDGIFAMVAVAIMAAALAAFFRFTRLGIALRASAENADRASLLGIPVKRVQTAAWMIAGLFGSVTIFARSSLVGVPSDGSLGYSVLLFALAPAVLARMESVPVAVVGGIAVGIIESGAVGLDGDNDLAAAIMLLVILGTLLVQRGTLSRAYDAGTSSWQALQEYRPIPTELRRLPEVVGARSGLAVVAIVLLVVAPNLVTKGEVSFLATLPIAGMTAISLVILTGWAGQISLGQFALVGAGAVTAGKFATEFAGGFWSDFWVTLALGAAAGALVAVLVGMPAVRIQGLFLAVTTLSLAGATHLWLMNRDEPVGRLVMPVRNARVQRPILWQRIDLNNERTMYYVCLAFLAASAYAATRFRRSRSGRVLIAVRDNQRAAPAYAINLVRTRLAAFAVAGAIAASAGVLLAYQQRAIDPSTYGIGPSVAVFVATVMGGLTSVAGAVFGAMGIEAVERFGESRLDGISLLVTGPGLLFILLFLPGGFAEAAYRMRDAYLRWVANRRGILVPSLLADRRVELDEDHVVEAAEHHVLGVDPPSVADPDLELARS